MSDAQSMYPASSGAATRRLAEMRKRLAPGPLEAFRAFNEAGDDGVARKSRAARSCARARSGPGEKTAGIQNFSRVSEQPAGILAPRASVRAHGRAAPP